MNNLPIINGQGSRIHPMAIGPGEPIEYGIPIPFALIPVFDPNQPDVPAFRRITEILKRSKRDYRVRAEFLSGDFVRREHAAALLDFLTQTVFENRTHIGIFAMRDCESFIDRVRLWTPAGDGGIRSGIIVPQIPAKRRKRGAA